MKLIDILSVPFFFSWSPLSSCSNLREIFCFLGAVFSSSLVYSLGLVKHVLQSLSLLEKAVMGGKNFEHCMSENVFILPNTLLIAEYRILSWKLYSLRILKAWFNKAFQLYLFLLRSPISFLFLIICMGLSFFPNSGNF